MQCLEIQKGDVKYPDKWRLFYSSIEGFEYEQGYIYKLIVREENIPPNKVPADGSSIKYMLIKVLEKERDPKLRLYDIWALKSIDSKQVNVENLQKHPTLEINLNKMKIHGNDGCNKFLVEQSRLLMTN